MRRRSFLALAGAMPLAPAAVAAAGAGTLPAELRGGRLFATPRVPDGRVFACWLDTSGEGFIFDWAIERFRIPVRTTQLGSRTAPLPAFSPPDAIPPLLEPDPL